MLFQKVSGVRGRKFGHAELASSGRDVEAHPPPRPLRQDLLKGCLIRKARRKEDLPGKLLPGTSSSPQVVEGDENPQQLRLGFIPQPGKAVTLPSQGAYPGGSEGPLRQPTYGRAQFPGCPGCLPLRAPCAVRAR